MSIEEQKPKHPRLDQGPDYERGFIDGMQEQMKRSVDRAVNAMGGKEERNRLALMCEHMGIQGYGSLTIAAAIRKENDNDI